MVLICGTGACLRSGSLVLTPPPTSFWPSPVTGAATQKISIMNFSGTMTRGQTALCCLCCDCSLLRWGVGGGQGVAG